MRTLAVACGLASALAAACSSPESSLKPCDDKSPCGIGEFCDYGWSQCAAGTDDVLPIGTRQVPGVCRIPKCGDKASCDGAPCTVKDDCMPVDGSCSRDGCVLSPPTFIEDKRTCRSGCIRAKPPFGDTDVCFCAACADGATPRKMHDQAQ